jgi:integrase
MLRWYRRHSRECEFGPEGHPEQGLRAKLSAKGLSKKEIASKLHTWKQCDCQCWFTGTWNKRRYPRESLGVNDWKRAEELIDQKMQSRATISARLLLKDALNKWHRECELAKRAPGTLRNHRERGDELLELVGETALLGDVSPDHISDLRAGWVRRKVGDNTQRTWLAYLDAFFHFCQDGDRRWIEHSPMPPKKNWPPKPTGEDREETLPLDPDGGDANYQEVLAALRGPRTWRKQAIQNKPGPLMHGERLALLCELMYEAGLRVSDAIMFRPAKLVMDTEVAQYTYVPIKSRRKAKTCTTFMPAALACRLRAFHMLAPGYPFWDGRRPHENLGDMVRQELAKAGDACDVPGVRPHRFRDSFAVNQLNHGVPIEAVSQMLGHSSIRTTEESYAPWVKSRITFVRNAYVQAQQAAKPLPPNVIPMPRAASE